MRGKILDGSTFESLHSPLARRLADCAIHKGIVASGNERVKRVVHRTMPKKTRQEMLHDRAFSIIALGQGIQFGSERQGGVTDDVGLAQFNHAGLSLLHDLYGPDHFHTKAFDERLDTWSVAALGFKIGILRAVDFAIEGGWYESTRALIAGELFDDFLEMASHLVDEGYKDAAAVIAGSSLEAHLKRLAVVSGIELVGAKGEPKKAELLNQELHKADAYLLNEQKQVTAWLGIRNDAAHGEYAKVIAGSVRLMVDGVRHFITVHPA